MYIFWLFWYLGGSSGTYSNLTSSSHFFNFLSELAASSAGGHLRGKPRARVSTLIASRPSVIRSPAGMTWGRESEEIPRLQRPDVSRSARTGVHRGAVRCKFQREDGNFCRCLGSIKFFASHPSTRSRCLHSPSLRPQETIFPKLKISEHAPAPCP